MPALSVPDAGGPTVPVVTVKLVERVPVAVVVFSVRKGFVQETGTAFPATEMVGWPGALLHSRTAPVALSGYPEAVTVTDCPLVSPVFGKTPRVGAAAAGLEKARTPTIPEVSTTAAAIANRASLPKRRICPPGHEARP